MRLFEGSVSRLLWFLLFPATLAAQQIATYPAGSEPACDASKRGTLIISLGKEGQSDGLRGCFRDGLGRYAWATPGQQSMTSFMLTRKLGGCPIFPDNNVWNSRADSLAEDAESEGIIATYAAARLGSDPGMAINIAPAAVPGVPVFFTYSGESDLSVYPVSPDMQMEGYGANQSFPVSGGPYKNDAHLLVIRASDCKLFEIARIRTAKPPYQAAAGAIFDLTRNDLRPADWTSADAAGLPIWPGVLRYAEVFGQGEIAHVLRFTVDRSRAAYVWPARHFASRFHERTLPPMGSRWRLKASFDDKTCRASEHTGAAFPPEMQKVIRALKQYGMMLADNGMAIRLTADADQRWGDAHAETSATWKLNGWLHCVQGSDFEVVNASPLIVNSNSAATSN